MYRLLRTIVLVELKTARSDGRHRKVKERYESAPEEVPYDKNIWIRKPKKHEVTSVWDHRPLVFQKKACGMCTESLYWNGSRAAQKMLHLVPGLHFLDKCTVVAGLGATVRHVTVVAQIRPRHAPSILLEPRTILIADVRSQSEKEFRILTHDGGVGRVHLS